MATHLAPTAVYPLVSTVENALEGWQITAYWNFRWKAAWRGNEVGLTIDRVGSKAESSPETPVKLFPGSNRYPD